MFSLLLRFNLLIHPAALRYRLLNGYGWRYHTADVRNMITVVRKLIFSYKKEIGLGNTIICLKIQSIEYIDSIDSIENRKDTAIQTLLERLLQRTRCRIASCALRGFAKKLSI